MCGRYYVEPESSSELLELIAEAKRKSDEVKSPEYGGHLPDQL